MTEYLVVVGSYGALEAFTVEAFDTMEVIEILKGDGYNTDDEFCNILWIAKHITYH